MSPCPPGAKRGVALRSDPWPTVPGPPPAAGWYHRGPFIMSSEARHDSRLQRLEARTHLDGGVETWVEYAEACFQKGYYFGHGEPWFHKARAALHQAIELGEAGARAWNVLANTNYGLSEFDEAERCYLRAIQADPHSALAFVGLGNLHKERGSHARAVDAFSRAVELDPSLWQAHYNLGGALYAEARDRDWKGVHDRMERAIYHLVSALRLRPFETFVGNIYKDLGELFLHTHQHKHARRFFERLLDHPDHGGLAHYYLGLTHFAMGHYTHAIQHYRAYLKVEPESALAWAKIGLSWLELGEWDRAREACEQALIHEPTDGLARFTLGCIELDQRQYAQAAERFEALLADDPEAFGAWVELVRTHWLRGDYGWLFDTLRTEVRRFEDQDGPDGGREFYKGERGRTRRRIDVLLAQIQEVGIDSFGSLAEIVEEVQTDSLRFQIWEQLYDMSRRHRVAQVVDQLTDPDEHFGRELGRNVLLLAPFLPEDRLMAGGEVTDEAVARRAVGARRADDPSAFAAATTAARDELRDYQAFLLLALATKGTPSAEDFLLDRLHGGPRELRISAAIALLFYGSSEAIDLLRSEAERVPPAAAARLQELIAMGQDQSGVASNVLRVDTGAWGRRSSAAPERCTICRRDAEAGGRLLCGERAIVCALCLTELQAERATAVVPEAEDQCCSLCGATPFDAAPLLRKAPLLLCAPCLDTNVQLLLREEVERYLAEWN